MAGLYTREPLPNKLIEGLNGSSCYSRPVTRPRSSAPGRGRPARHRSPSIPGRLVSAMVLFTLVAAACGGATGTASPSKPSAGGSTEPIVLVTDDPSASDVASHDAGTSDPVATVAPTDTAAASTEPAPSVALEPATDCTGTAGNRTFYSSVAAAVAWTVYCPVLPSGWFVETGQYRLADGGRLTVTYRGPDGARFTLSEGAWCAQPSCLETAADLGTASFGDREGSIAALSAGGYAITVDGGSPISWALVGDGLDEGSVRMFGAALIAVGG